MYLTIVATAVLGVAVSSSLGDTALSKIAYLPLVGVVLGWEMLLYRRGEMKPTSLRAKLVLTTLLSLLILSMVAIGVLGLSDLPG